MYIVRMAHCSLTEEEENETLERQLTMTIISSSLNLLYRHHF